MIYQTKDPDATLDYQVDWGQWLKGDQIQASTWTLLDSEASLTIVSDSYTLDSSTVMLSGGTLNQVYVLTNRIVTLGGRVEEQMLVIKCMEGALVAGQNSFGTLIDMVVVMAEMPMLRALPSADRRSQEGAMIQAWHNISRMPVEIYPGLDPNGEYDRYNPPMNRLAQEPGSPFLCTAHLTAELLTTLHPRALLKLRRAQLIEADLILGANPIEDRRRLGLISDSSGESAQFFRTRIPLELPVRRETATELTGLIRYSFRTGRG